MQNCPSSSKVKNVSSDTGGRYGLSVSEEATVKEGGPRMISASMGYSSGMVECRWYDGFGVKAGGIP